MNGASGAAIGQDYRCAPLNMTNVELFDMIESCLTSFIHFSPYFLVTLIFTIFLQHKLLP